MVRLLAGVALALLVGGASADDKKESKDATTWVREANGLDLKLEFGKEKLVISVFNGEDGVIATCKMAVDKEGLVKATITDVEEKGTFPAKPKKGLEFTFKWKADGSKGKLSDLKGDDVDEAKAVIEGEYDKKDK